MAKISDISFFMIVTEPSVPIADFCIRSYKRLKKCHFSFELIVYGNNLSVKTKKHFYNAWKRLDYVHLVDNDAYLTDSYPIVGNHITTPEGIQRQLYGNYELCGTIWTRELPQIPSPFVATVDSDFEILSPEFVELAHKMLLEDSSLAGVSTDYSPDNEKFYNPYWETTHFLHQRWHTWFCMYRKECLQSDVSHYLYQHIGPHGLQVYDCAGYLQASLIKKGWHFSALSSKMSRMYLHYVAFSNNTKINEQNIQAYHRYMVWMRRGLIPCLGFKGSRGRLNRWWGYLIHELYVRRFGGVNQDREKYNFLDKSKKDNVQQK